MSKDNPLEKRKTEHISIVLNQKVEPQDSCFGRWRLPYRSLPEINYGEIDTQCTFLGKMLRFPFLISSMTGGPRKARIINQHLAIAAEQAGVALGLGSMRIILRDPAAIASFKVRHLCPSVPLLANMGLVQLNYGYGADDINRIVDAIGADGIFLHVNPLQEAIQPEGDTCFAGLLARLAEVLPKVKVPVVIKEVGAGIDPGSARRLREIGVEWIDVAGTGGTSWAMVEGYRRSDRLGEVFQSVGLPTDEALMGAAQIKGLRLIGSGGIRNGLDMAKALMLGADLVGTAKPLLQPALESVAACSQLIECFHKELKTAMFCTGSKNLAELKAQSLELCPR